jgi:preprotein translocase subunit SecG
VFAPASAFRQRVHRHTACLEDFMYQTLMVLHLLICLSLVAVVLVQSGKGGGLAGGAFGGSAQTVFGGRGATDFITRATMVLGAAFFLTSLALAKMSSSPGTGARSLIQEQARKSAATAPAQAPTTPGTAPTGGTAPAPTPAPATTPAGGTK